MVHLPPTQHWLHQDPSEQLLDDTHPIFFLVF